MWRTVLESDMNTIAIVSVVDVVGALAANDLTGSFYLFDDNKSKGSRDEGTEALQTRVSKGDQVVWTSIPLECEAYISISGVEIDKKYKDYCDVRKDVYPGTNVVYWLGEIRKELDGPIPYTLKFKLGSHKGEFAISTSPALIGDPPAPAQAAPAAAATAPAPSPSPAKPR
ncbi:hypothetical protein D4Q52_09485 [Rhodopseudomonas palustris]|uniref:Uncharacterized protein n=2 Tax=Rhodopseudomonas palustris TaxID=1076 RepID=A0A418VH27_RHOPL|nr:hypothetical protein D4Q52_09485 [Rhodopseudomonas palustris]